MDRDQALQKLHEMVQSPSLRKHSYAVEKVMVEAASHYGEAGADSGRWGLAGLLHDADYELFPAEHPNRIVAWLLEQGEEEIAYAISAHWTRWKIPHHSPMDRALLACDELTGFIVACSLLRPDGLLGLEARSVIKKLKNPKFAAGVERDEVYAGIELLGVALADHISFIIEALRPYATELNLDGHHVSERVS